MKHNTVDITAKLNYRGDMSDHEKKFQENADPEEIKQAKMFVLNFFALFKAVNLYPSGHKILLQTAEKFYDYMKSFLEKKQTAILRIFENKLYFHDLLLDPEKIPEINSFIEKMQKRYIRQIIFDTGTDINDINALITLINTASESITLLGGIHAILKQNGAKHIRVIEYYYKHRNISSHEISLNITDNPILQFFIDDSKISLPIEQAYLLYELLKETPSVCKLIKTASQYKIHNQVTKLPEDAIILAIIKKIKPVIDAHNISEESEMITILQDIITSFPDEEFFEFIFAHSNDKLINYIDVTAFVPEKLGSQKTAEFIVQKIIDSNENIKIISRAKSVLKKIFTDVGEARKFLSVFEDTVRKNIHTTNRAKQIIDEICSSIDPDYYLKIDTELSLGAISEIEKADIQAGLNILKTVPLNKEMIKKRISSFDIDPVYFLILENLLEGEKKIEMFTRMLNKLIEYIKILIKQNKMQQVQKIFSFFFTFITDQKRMTPEQKKIIIDSLANIPLPVLEDLVTKTFSLPDEKTIGIEIRKLFILFPSKLMMLILKRFISGSNMPNEHLFRKILLANYRPGSIDFNEDLLKVPIFQIMRLMDLLQDIKSDEILPFLWEITFLDNTNVAQKSLKLIALKNFDKSLSFLLKAIDRSEISLRTMGIEYLKSYDTKETQSILIGISEGKKSMTNSLLTNINLRKTALRSLESLSSAKAVNIYNEIINKKRLFFINAEPKQLRLFAEERLKQFS